MATDPFAVLGLPAAYELDEDELERRYRDLQKALHPDRHAGAPPEERRIALSRAVEVNEAYRTLRDDLARARALLALRGHAQDEKKQPADPAFLMEIMERREALSDARAARDLGRVRTLAGAVRAEAERARARLAKRFAAEARPEEIAEELAKLRYYRRFLDEVEVIEEEALRAPT